MADPRDPKVVWDTFYQGTWIPWRDGFLSRLDQLEKQVALAKARMSTGKGEQGEKGDDGPSGDDGDPGPQGDAGPDGYPPPIACAWNASLKLNSASATRSSFAATAAEIKLVGASFFGTAVSVDLAAAKDCKLGNSTDTEGKVMGIRTFSTWADVSNWYNTPSKNEGGGAEQEVDVLKND